MSGTPALIVLYDTDAVEVRCSDGSRLELSPCGATMSYQPPIQKGDHPRKGISSRVHKRTCFVTSDYKKIVLQTLDFRNRFALRPYLCEELQNKEDVLTLYASIDSIRWPDSVDNANVEILADGSRKVTSLDDFASLVVSPHGQDFSISYLSRISFDDKGKDSSPQFLQSSHVSYCLSRNKTETSNNLIGGKSSCEKSNEAIVQPFQLMSVKDQQCSDPTSPSVTVAQVFKNNNHSVPFANIKISGALRIDHDSEDILDKSSSHSDLDKTLVEEESQRLEAGHRQSPRDCLAKFCNDENKYLPNDVEGSIPISPRLNQDESGSIICGSPVTHDISSISRSSTPDGLRTTIDSDATLIHENNECEALPVHRMIYNQHRHSSPTHCSSPFDNIVKNDGITMKQNQPSAPPLDGSYLEMHRHSPVGFDCNDKGACDGVQKIKFCAEPSLKNQNIDELKNNSDSHNQLMTQVKSGDAQTYVNSPKTRASPVGISSPTCQKIVQERKMVSNYDRTQHALVTNKEKSLESFQCSVSLQGQPAAVPLEVNQAAKETKTFSGNSTNDDGSSGLSQVHHESESHLASSQDDLHPLSSVVENDEEDESACRKKYVWVTRHASRMCCPKEWTHPLMLALKAESSCEKKRQRRGKESHKQLPVTKPLPLTCPFQHKHRMSNSKDYTQELSDHGQQKEDKSITSTIGEFQHGRLKVVVSEGIIYRLTSCNEMTVVEVYPGDGSVLVSQGVKAVFFTHFIPRANVLEERTYSLKSLPPGCAKGRHSIEKMMKTANRLVQICLNWDMRCGKGKPPCWQKEVVAVVQPLSSSLLEECCVSGLGRFSAFTNGRVRILFDDRTSLDTVADFKPRLGNVTEMQQNSLFRSDSGDTTARLLVTSGNYITVDMNKPGNYAKYASAAKEWIAWVNASQTERQEFYKQQNQPHIIQKAAELELKKIFCFNYILEHTAALQDGGTNLAAKVNHITTNPRSSSSSHEDVTKSSSNEPLPSSSAHLTDSHTPSFTLPFDNIPGFRDRIHQHAIPPSSSLSPSLPHNNRAVPSTNHVPSPPTHPSIIAMPSHYNPHNPKFSTPLHHQLTTSSSSSYHHHHHHHLTHPNLLINNHNTPHASTFYNNTNVISSTQHNTPMPHTNLLPQYSSLSYGTKPFSSHIPLHNHPLSCDTRFATNTSSHHEDKCVDTTMGFQSVRSALARTSSLINDIEMFLEDTKP